MSFNRICDVCNEIIDGDAVPDELRGARLFVYGFYDDYNTESRTIELDICNKCLYERFSKKELMNGREF